MKPLPSKFKRKMAWDRAHPSLIGMPSKPRLPADVWEQQLRLRRIRWHRQHAMVHEGCAVDKTLIVDTNHHGLLHAIDGDVVHHILLAAQKLLKNCRALCLLKTSFGMK